MGYVTETDQIHWLQTATAGQRLEISGITVMVKFLGKLSNNACAVLEMQLPPAFPGHEPHVHRQTTETFYIISGTVAFTLGIETMIARQGATVLVRPGIVHHFWNPSPDVARMLVVLTPGGAEQYYLELAAVLAPDAARSPPSLNQIAALGANYDHFPVTP